MGPSTPECVCVTPMCVEQGKYAAGWGGGGGACVCVCTRLDRPSPEPWNPSVYVGRSMPAAWCAWAMGDTSVQDGRNE